MFFSRIGTVQDVSSHSSQQRIHKGVGIFSASMEIEGTANFKPSPRMGEEANLCFNLNILLNVGLALLGDSSITYGYGAAFTAYHFRAVFQQFLSWTI
eukprot:scaffold3965_cov154-Skeletonema_marinoi.AAC.4